MSKKIALVIIIVLDVLVAIFFFVQLINASRKLTFAYVERGDIRPSSILSYLDWESYGVAGVLARPGRVGESVKEEDQDLYLLGEYADLLYWEKIFAADGNEGSASKCVERRKEIRNLITEYGTLLDKMDQSVENAIKK